MTLQVQQTIPVLRMFDVAKAREFYVAFLGFTIDWEHRFHPQAPRQIRVTDPFGNRLVFNEDLPKETP